MILAVLLQILLLCLHLNAACPLHLGLDRRHIPNSSGCSFENIKCLSNILEEAAERVEYAADFVYNLYDYRFEMYFKTTAMEDRHEVSDYYRKIANVARIGAMGNIRFYCDSKNDLDPNNSGQGDMCMKNRTRNNKVAAYSRSGLDRIVMCETYWNDYNVTSLPAGRCDYDQAQIMIHEMSHMASIRTNRCLDYGTGFAEIMKLSREDALMNSDTYAMYASHVYKDCHRSRRPEVIAPPQIVVEDPVIIGDSVFPEDDSMAFAVGLEEDIVIGFLKSAANGGRTVGGGFFLVMAWLAMLYMCVLWG